MGRRRAMDDRDDFLSPEREDPMDILRARLARGEITADEYHELATTLRAGTAPGA